jgi:hypothetical protein
MPHSSAVIKKLEKYVKNKTKVTLQVKDLEPTVGDRHLGEGKNEYITGILSHDRFSPKVFLFLEDGKEGRQDVLESSLDKIKKAGDNNNNPNNDNNNNMSGGRRNQSRKKRKPRYTRRR